MAIKKSTGKAEFLSKAAPNAAPKSKLKTGILKQQEEIKQLTASLADKDEIFVYNATKGAFHLAPTNMENQETQIRTAIKFEMAEIKMIPVKTALAHEDFLKALQKGQLEIKTEEEVTELEEARERLIKKSSKNSSKAGVSKSGLSNNYRAAIEQIWETDDVETLDEFRDLEDREDVISAIDRRIGEIEDQG